MTSVGRTWRFAVRLSVTLGFLVGGLLGSLVLAWWGVVLTSAILLAASFLFTIQEMKAEDEGRTR